MERTAQIVAGLGKRAARVRTRYQHDRKLDAAIGRARPMNLETDAIVEAVAIRVEPGDLNPDVVANDVLLAEDGLGESIHEAWAFALLIWRKQHERERDDPPAHHDNAADATGVSRSAQHKFHPQWS